MAVYEHLYGAYEGESHSAWSRFLVIPRYALRETFKSKLLVTVQMRKASDSNAATGSLARRRRRMAHTAITTAALTSRRHGDTVLLR